MELCTTMDFVSPSLPNNAKLEFHVLFSLMSFNFVQFEGNLFNLSRAAIRSFLLTFLFVKRPIYHSQTLLFLHPRYWNIEGVNVIYNFFCVGSKAIKRAYMWTDGNAVYVLAQRMVFGCLCSFSYYESYAQWYLIGVFTNDASVKTFGKMSVFLEEIFEGVWGSNVSP